MSDKIEELKKRRAKANIKRKKTQIPFAFILTIILILIYVHLLRVDQYHSIFWIVGILTGFVIQKSRLCFSASFRDPILIGSTKVFRAIIIGIIISSIGFMIIQYNAVLKASDYSSVLIPGIIEPVGLHTLIGGIMFGIGMVIAGGCATGTLYRIGEGFQMQIIVLIGFVIGSLLGAVNYEFWYKNFISKSPKVYFPKHLGFELATVIQVTVLISIYIIAYKYDKRKNKMKS